MDRELKTDTPTVGDLASSTIKSEKLSRKYFQYHEDQGHEPTSDWKKKLKAKNIRNHERGTYNEPINIEGDSSTDGVVRMLIETH